MKSKHLILGGARSGKSRYAEQLVIELASGSKTNESLVYLASATADDDEMGHRIDQHKRQRGNKWQLIEEPIQVGKVLREADSEATILLDCLTLWLSNCLHKECWPEQREVFLEALNLTKANIVMVSNEVGNGIVPMGQLSRQFVDESGWLHQQVAQECDHVCVLIAGLPMTLKGNSLHAAADSTRQRSR